MKTLQTVAKALVLLSTATCTVAAPTAGSTDNTGTVAGEPFSGAFSSITREEILERLFLERLFTTAKEGKLAKRTPGGISLCTGTHWRGTCGYAVQKQGEFIVLDAPWKNSVSSMGVDKGTDVFLFPSTADNCMGSEAGSAFGELQYPGLDDFTTKLGWNNNLGMFIWHPVLTGA